MECMKRKNELPFDKNNNKNLLIQFLLQMSILYSHQMVRCAHPSFQKYPVNSTFSIFLKECSIKGITFLRRLSFFGVQSICEYFMGESRVFRGFFTYFNESRSIKITYNKILSIKIKGKSKNTILVWLKEKLYTFFIPNMVK